MPRLPQRSVFKCLPLSVHAKNELIDQAKEACEGLILNATTTSTYPIETVVRYSATGQHLTIYTAKDNKDTSWSGCVAHMRVRGSIEDASGFFHRDTPEKTHQYTQVFQEEKTIGRTLYSLVERPIADDSLRPLHYVAIEWTVERFNFGIPPRDLCFLEAHDEFTVTDPSTGQLRRGWVRCIHSIELATCPSIEDSHGIIRMQIVRSGHVFLETNEPGMMDYYRVHFGRPGGALLGRHFHPLYLRGITKKLIKTTLHLAEHFMLQRVYPAMDTSPMDFQSTRGKRHCGYCYVSISWFSPKKQCRSCGTVLCHKCATNWTLLRHRAVVRVPLCPACVDSSTALMTNPIKPTRRSLPPDHEAIFPRSLRRPHAQLNEVSSRVILDPPSLSHFHEISTRQSPSSSMEVLLQRSSHSMSSEEYEDKKFH